MLVSGPTALSPKNSQIELIRVVSAKQMHTAVFQHYHKVDIAIVAAAVADFVLKPCPTKNQEKWVFQ